METDKIIKHLKPAGLELSKFNKVSEHRSNWCHLTTIYDAVLVNNQKVRLKLFFWVLPGIGQIPELRLSCYSWEEIS